MIAQGDEPEDIVVEGASADVDESGVLGDDVFAIEALEQIEGQGVLEELSEQGAMGEDGFEAVIGEVAWGGSLICAGSA